MRLYKENKKQMEMKMFIKKNFKINLVCVLVFSLFIQIFAGYSFDGKNNFVKTINFYGESSGSSLVIAFATEFPQLKTDQERKRYIRRMRKKLCGCLKSRDDRRIFANYLEKYFGNKAKIQEEDPFNSDNANFIMQKLIPPTQDQDAKTKKDDNLSSTPQQQVKVKREDEVPIRTAQKHGFRGTALFTQVISNTNNSVNMLKNYLSNLSKQQKRQTLRQGTETKEELINVKYTGQNTDYEGCTALIITSKQRSADKVILLLEHEADPNICDNNGKTALDWAVTNKDIKTVKVLAGNKKTDPKIISKCLLKACENLSIDNLEMLDIIEVLLEAKEINVNVENNDKTPLRLIMDFIIINTDKIDSDEKIFEKIKSIVQKLRSNGAQINDSMQEDLKVFPDNMKEIFENNSNNTAVSDSGVQLVKRKLTRTRTKKVTKGKTIIKQTTTTTTTTTTIDGEGFIRRKKLPVTKTNKHEVPSSPSLKQLTTRKQVTIMMPPNPLLNTPEKTGSNSDSTFDNSNPIVLMPLNIDEEYKADEDSKSKNGKNYNNNDSIHKELMRGVLETEEVIKKLASTSPMNSQNTLKTNTLRKTKVRTIKGVMSIFPKNNGDSISTSNSPLMSTSAAIGMAETSFLAAAGVIDERSIETVNNSLDPNNANRVNVNTRHIKVRDNEYTGYTALIKASKIGYVEMVRLLLQHRADPNIKDSLDKTALDWAVEKGYVDTIKELVSDLRTEVNDNLLDWAVENGHVEIIRALVQNGKISENALNKFFLTLFKKLSKDNLEALNVVDILLESKTINVNAQDENKKTPLHFIASLIIDATSLETSEVSFDNQTLVRIGVTVQKLLDHGALTDIKDSSDDSIDSNLIILPDIIQKIFTDYKKHKEEQEKQKKEEEKNKIKFVMTNALRIACKILKVDTVKLPANPTIGRTETKFFKGGLSPRVNQEKVDKVDQKATLMNFFNSFVKSPGKLSGNKTPNKMDNTSYEAGSSPRVDQKIGGQEEGLFEKYKDKINKIYEKNPKLKDYRYMIRESKWFGIVVFFVISGARTIYSEIVDSLEDMNVKYLGLSNNVFDLMVFTKICDLFFIAGQDEAEKCIPGIKAIYNAV
jgi:ankyrin repeat protein